MTLLTILQHDRTKLVPLIFNFKDKIKKHIILYDTAKNDTDVAEEIRHGILMLNEKYSLDSEIEMLMIDEDSHGDMLNIQKRLKKEQTGSLYLNAAGADTALVVVLSGYVLDNGGKILAYDKQDNSYNIITRNGFTNHPIEHNMMLDDFLILTAESIKEESDKEKAYQRRDAIMMLFSDAKRMFKVRKLLDRDKFYEMKDQYEKLVPALKELGIINNALCYSDRTQSAKFGQFFEEFIYLFLREYDFDDIKMGVKIVFEHIEDDNSNMIDVSNEFDLLMIKNNRIGFVECKIGNRVNPLETIYKSDALMDYFGEDSRCLIVNIQPDPTPHLSNSKVQFGPSMKLRANKKRIEVFNAFDLGKKKFSSVIEEVFGVKRREVS